MSQRENVSWRKRNYNYDKSTFIDVSGNDINGDGTGRGSGRTVWIGKILDTKTDSDTTVSLPEIHFFGPNGKEKWLLEKKMHGPTYVLETKNKKRSFWKGTISSDCVLVNCSSLYKSNELPAQERKLITCEMNGSQLPWEFAEKRDSLVLFSRWFAAGHAARECAARCEGWR